MAVSTPPVPTLTVQPGSAAQQGLLPEDFATIRSALTPAAAAYERKILTRTTCAPRARIPFLDRPFTQSDQWPKSVAAGADLEDAIAAA